MRGWERVYVYDLWTVADEMGRYEMQLCSYSIDGDMNTLSAGMPAVKV
jgi:hypothetical protein